jgi:hypothetical protein
MNMDFLIGASHDNILPVMIDINDRIIIGLIINIFSLIESILGLDCEDHIVTILNRIE